MKKCNKLLVNSLIYLALFAIFGSFVEKPKEIQTSKQIIARRGHHRGHRRHDRGRGGIYFRFDVGPRERYYYHRYREYVSVNFEIFDDNNTQVTELQVGDRIVYVNGARNGVRYHFSLRPGYYTVRWKVVNNRFFGPKYRNYSRRLRVRYDRDQIYVTIIGNRISIR